MTAAIARISVLLLLLTGCGEPKVPTPVAPEPTPAPTRDVLAEIQARGSVRVGTEFNSKPMVFAAEDGSVTGFEYRLMQGLARHLGVSLEPVGGTFKDLPETMASGAADVVIAGWIPSPEVDAAYSRSYLETGLCMTVRRGSPIRRIEDLRGKKVGIYADPTVMTWASRALEGSEVLALSDGYFKMLVGEDLDAVIYDYPFAVAEIAPYKAQLEIAQVNLSAIRYSVLVPQGTDALLDSVNTWVDGLRASPEYRALIEEFMTPEMLDAGDLGSGRVHVTRAGENLQSIADKYYGDPDQWKTLWKANKGHVAFPELVPKGTRVLIP